MTLTGENFKPCDCCKPPEFRTLNFKGDYYLYECNDTCGVINDIFDAGSYPRQVGEGENSYTATTYANVNRDLCQYYRVFNQVLDYSVVPIPSISDIVCDIITTYFLDENNVCQSVNSRGPQDANCDGIPGNSRDVYLNWENPINDCEYKLSSGEWPVEVDLEGFEALEYKSRAGNKKEKSTTTLKKIIHDPTVTCYLKVWARGLIQSYEIVPRDSDSYEPPDLPVFTEDPECIGGGPYWENDPCYRRVVENDSFCCENTWDARCQEDYELCQSETAPPPAGGPCDGPFLLGGETTTGSVFIYEWKGTGRPCLRNGQKSPSDPENLIESEINWHFEVDEPEIGTGKEMELEFKWSFVEGYEPLWPSERDEDDCKPNGFPKC